MLGTALLVVGGSVLAFAFVPYPAVEWMGLQGIRYFYAGSGSFLWTGMNWLFAGFLLRNSYAADLGEGPQYRTPRWRRIGAVVFFAAGLFALASPLIIEASPFLSSPL